MDVGTSTSGTTNGRVGGPGGRRTMSAASTPTRPGVTSSGGSQRTTGRRSRSSRGGGPGEQAAGALRGCGGDLRHPPRVGAVLLPPRGGGLPPREAEQAVDRPRARSEPVLRDLHLQEAVAPPHHEGAAEDVRVAS